MEWRRRVWIMASVCLFASLDLPAWGKYGGGQGTVSDPYLIYTVEDFKALRADRGNWGYYDHYKLMADLDLTGVEIQPFGTSDRRFVGTFDGNGKTISNLKIDVSSGDYVGLFGYAEAEIRNLRLVDVDINAPLSDCVGALAGRAVRGPVDNCCVEGGRVVGAEMVGGLIGESSVSLNQCYTTGQVTGTAKVGGLSGLHREYQTVNQCYSVASVSGDTQVGGLVGFNRGVVTDSYASGEVNGRTLVGGVAGNSPEGAIWNCYAIGRVHGEAFVGGLAGQEAMCYRSFWDTEATGQVDGPCGVGKTSSQMHEASLYRGWGRSGAWTIDEGADYPRLAWEGREGIPLTTPAFPENTGSGTADDPYLIYTAEQLNEVGECPGEWDRCFSLEADVDLAELTDPFRIIGFKFVRFAGTFDGKGHTIANLECPYMQHCSGMFAFVYGGTIKRVTLLNPRNDTPGWSLSAGTLVGRQVDGLVEACGAEGGLVLGDVAAGGLIGRSERGTISRCYSTSTVVGQGQAEGIGGLIGKGERSNVDNCYATGDVSGLHQVGGLIGQTSSAGSVSHCYAAGPVTCPQDAWTVPDAGGLIGTASQTLVASCFWDTETSGFATSAGGEGASTSELQQASTFIEAGWDFEGERANGLADIWCIEDGGKYPTFASPSEAPPESDRSDDFADGLTAAMWQVYEPTPTAIALAETGGRLEVVAPIGTLGAQAFYVSQDGLLDTAEDFFITVDFHFTASAAGEGWVVLGLTPEPDNPNAQCVELAAGCLENETVFMARKSAGGWRQKWWADRPSDSGRLYLSYESATDTLYLSFTGHGPANAWQTITGVVNGSWAGQPIHVMIGGKVMGMTLDGSEAWLDNFSVDSDVATW